MLAYAIPGTVIGVGLIVVYNHPPIVLTGTWVILLVSYFIRHLPYPVRACTAMLQQIDLRVEEASISLSVPPFRTFWRVTVPLMFPAILSGAALAWMTTIGELSSSILLYSGPWATMSVAIFTQVAVTGSDSSGGSSTHPDARRPRSEERTAPAIQGHRDP